jgi:hypothetical protein
VVAAESIRQALLELGLGDSGAAVVIRADD